MKSFLLKISNLILREKIRANFKKEDGISLVEVAIGLIVLGLVVTPLIQAYKVEEIRESKSSTRGSLATAQNLINQYYGIGNGIYPCPASLTLKEGDPNFGVEGDCTLSNIKLCTNVLWRTTEGICKTDDTADAVIIGGIPFSTLLMRQENALDYWGNKIIYAVTFEQTNNITFAGNDGAIFMDAVDDPVGVQNGSEDGIPEEKSDTVDFLFLSTGSSGVGGFTKDGVPISVCGTVVNGYESENCDFDNRFFYDIAPFNSRASAFSLVVGVNFYDDIMLAQESVPEATWFQHPDNTSYSNEFVITLATKVGIGTTTPNTSAAIDVVGDIRSEAMVKSDSICDVGSVNCFDPELITGTINKMKCDSDNSLYGNQAVMKLADSRVYCGVAEDNTGTNTAIENENLIEVDTSVVKIKSCPLGDLISGIDSNGDVICITP